MAETEREFVSLERILQYSIGNLMQKNYVDFDHNNQEVDFPETFLQNRAGCSIEVDNVSVSYNQNSYNEDGNSIRIRKTVFKNLSLKIDPGTCVGIVGKNGTGKTTFLKLILKLLYREDVSPPDFNLLIDGYQTILWHGPKLRQRIAVIPQEPLLFDATIEENILMNLNIENLQNVEKYTNILYKDPTFQTFRKILEMDICNSSNSLNNSINSKKNIGINGKNLSHGQRQIVALLREVFRIRYGTDIDNMFDENLEDNASTDDDTALIIEPNRVIPRGDNKSILKPVDGLSRKTSLLILDEPTSFLDGETEKLVCDCLKTLRQEFNLTVILIAHKRNTIEALCDRIVDFERIDDLQ